MRSPRTGLLLFVLTLVMAAPVAAGTYTVQFENDRIARTDRHYTHGSRFGWVSDRRTDDPAWVKDMLARLYPFANLRAGRVGLALGQNIYTPEDISASQLITDDRPYAGWLYLGFSAHAEALQPPDGWDTLDSVELQLGIVGPESFAEQIQNEFHDLIGVSRSFGWDNQLENEPGVMLVAERKLRSPPLRFAGMEADAIPRIGGSIGNVMTLASAGVLVRLGQELDIDYGPPQVRPSLSGLDAVNPGARFAWYLFGGADGRVVLRNIFLDGNSFANSHSVDKERFVADFQLGGAVVLYGVRLAFTHVFRTREFKGQRRADRYGTVSLSARF